MRKIAVTLPKGGVGKTTTAVNLAAALAISGKKTLLVDCDIQANATEHLGINKRDTLSFSDVVLKGKVEEISKQPEVRDNLWLLSGGFDLALVDDHLADCAPNEKHKRLRPIFSHSVFDKFDFILFDLAPGWNSLTKNVFGVATELLVPIQLDHAAMKSLDKFGVLFKAVHTYNPELKFRYILPTFLDRRVKKSEAYYLELTTKYPKRTLRPIRYNVRLAEAIKHGQTIFEHSPRAAGSDDYKRLARTIIRR